MKTIPDSIDLFMKRQLYCVANILSSGVAGVVHADYNIQMIPSTKAQYHGKESKP